MKTFKLDDIRLDTADLTPPSGARPPSPAGASAKRRRGFVIVSRMWRDGLQEARYIASYRIAFYLLYQHWWAKGRPTKLTNVAAAKAGVSPKAKWRALAELERLGLIAVERRPKKSPMITVLVN
jgi:hypothetical protein